MQKSYEPACARSVPPRPALATALATVLVQRDNLCDGIYYILSLTAFQLPSRSVSRTSGCETYVLLRYNSEMGLSVAAFRYYLPN